MLQHGWNLKTLLQEKEANHKRPHIIWFHFYEMSRRGKSIKTENRLVPKGLEKWRNNEVIIKANEDFLFGDANVLEVTLAMVSLI